MPFIPIDDSAPRVVIARPWVTWGLMAITIVVFWIQLSLGQDGGQAMIISFGVIPIVVEGVKVLPHDLALVDPWITLITYQFLHGGFMHLAGNMLFLWVFGDNVEDAMGHTRFLAFYLLGGLLAGLVHVLAEPQSQNPVIGASGAVSAVLGAYLVLHPKAKVLVPIYFIPLYLPAWLLLIFWFGYQFYALAGQGGTGGTAWWAHIGGFVAGMILILAFRYRATPLWGRSDPPSGITLRDQSRWQSGHKPSRKGPWT